MTQRQTHRVNRPTDFYSYPGYEPRGPYRPRMDYPRGGPQGTMYAQQQQHHRPNYVQLNPALSAAAYGSYIDPRKSQQMCGRYNNYGRNRTENNLFDGTNEDSGNEGSESQMSLSKTNIYIKGLDMDATDDYLLSLCDGLGRIISTKAIIDPETKQCRGYGFVDFETEDSAEKALTHLKEKGVQAQMAKQQERDMTNLYVANLPVSYQEGDLEKMFEPFGVVVSTRILRNPGGISRGVGFARMETRENCDAIIEAFHGKLLPSHMTQLTVKFADGGNKKRNSSRQWADSGTDSLPSVTPTPSYDETQFGGDHHNGVNNAPAISPQVSPYSMPPQPANYMTGLPGAIGVHGGMGGIPYYQPFFAMPTVISGASVSPGLQLQPGIQAASNASLQPTNLAALQSYPAAPYQAFYSAAVPHMPPAGQAPNLMSPVLGNLNPLQTSSTILAAQLGNLNLNAGVRPHILTAPTGHTINQSRIEEHSTLNM